MRKFVVTLSSFFFFLRGGGGGGETFILSKYMKGLKFNPDVNACVVYF